MFKKTVFPVKIHYLNEIYHHYITSVSLAAAKRQVAKKLVDGRCKWRQDNGYTWSTKSGDARVYLLDRSVRC